MKNTNLIGISGRIKSGKDTVAQMIIDQHSGYVVKQYGAKLKEIASILTGISVDDFEDRDIKDAYLNEGEWSYAKGFPEANMYNRKDSEHGYEWTRMTVRKFLQLLGTDAVREGLHQNAWVNALFADYKGHTPKVHSGSLFDANCYSHKSCISCSKQFYGYKRQPICKKCVDEQSPYYPNWIITDVRFENELYAIKERGGICIRLTRNEDVESDHISETALDSITCWDYVIDNKALTLEATKARVTDILKELKIV